MVIGSNNFAVALALGALGQAKRRFRIVLVFVAFEFLIPLAGIMLGEAVAGAIGTHANAVGAVLLCTLGLLTMISGLPGG